MRRKTPTINAGSMADIAFLLLIFWLVATTIKPEFGINNILKDKDEEPKIAIVTDSQDLLRVRVTDEGLYEIDGETVDYEELLARSEKLRELSGFKARIILTSDYNAPYKAYMDVLILVELLDLNLIENEIKE